MKMRQPRSPGGPEPFGEVDEAEPETKGPSVAKSLMVGAGVGLMGAARDFVFVGASQLGKNALSAGMGAWALTNPGGALAVSMTATCVMGMKPTMMAADTFSDAMGIQNSWLRMGIKVIPLGLALGLPGYFAFTGAIGTGASLAIALSSRLFSNLLRDTLNQMTAGVLPSVELVDAKGQALTGPQALVIEKRRVTLASLFYMGGIVATGWGGGSTALQKALNTHHGLDPGGAGSASVLARLGQALGGATGACWMEAFDSLQGVLLATTLALRAGGGVKCKSGNLQYLKQAAYDFDDLSTRISRHSGMRFNIALFSTGLGDYAKAIFPKDSPEAATLVRVSEFMAIFTEFRGYLVSQGQLAGLQKQHPEADLLAALEPYFGLTGPQLEFIVIDDLQHPGHTDFQAPPTSPLEFMARQSMTGAQYNDRKTKTEMVFAGRIDPLTPTEGVQASLFGADITVVDNNGGAVRFTVCEASERQTVLAKLGRNFRVLDQYKGQENVIEIPEATYVRFVALRPDNPVQEAQEPETRPVQTNPNGWLDHYRDTKDARVIFGQDGALGGTNATTARMQTQGLVAVETTHAQARALCATLGLGETGVTATEEGRAIVRMTVQLFQDHASGDRESALHSEAGRLVIRAREDESLAAQLQLERIVDGMAHCSTNAELPAEFNQFTITPVDRKTGAARPFHYSIPVDLLAKQWT